MSENNNPKKEAGTGSKPESNSKNNDKKSKFNITWVYALIAISLFGIFLFQPTNEPIEVTWNRFEQEMLKANDVQKIEVVNNKKVEIYIRPDRLKDQKYNEVNNQKKSTFSTSQNPQYFFTIGSVEAFENRMDEAQKDFDPKERIDISFVERNNHFETILNWLLFPLLLIGVWLFIFRKMAGPNGAGGQIFNIGKSKAKIFDKDTAEVKVDFKDVAGLEEAKVEIKEIVDFLKQPKKYTQLGGKIPKGALLVGPPGTGKTLLAKAVAGEAHVPFFSMSGSDFVEMFVGVGASRVRDLFKQAKEKAPCIIFIDEIEAIGRARGKNPNWGANDERENTLNQLLTEMDGFGTNSGVIILAATNRADILDRALLRAGRFDRQIHVELPDLNERKAIFEVHMKPLKLGPNVDFAFLSKQTPGFSGADIANVCNESALIAARRGATEIEKQDFLNAIDRIVGGLEKKNKIISLQEKKTIAHHEAGHATASWLLRYANPLIKVTIIPRGKALGAAWYLPEERQITTTEQLLDEMCATLGGRAAEEIIFNKISTGALNDLERVTKQAYAMITYFGMSEKLKNVSFYDSSGQMDYAFTKPYGDKVAEVIDKEVQDMVSSQYSRVVNILTENREGLEKLGALLLEREVIFSEDLEAIFGPRNFEEIEPIPVEVVHIPEASV